MSDAVNPKHYKQGDVECIDAIESATIGKKGLIAVCTANIIKYLWRCEDKNGMEDLLKARWYLDKLIASKQKGVILILLLLPLTSYGQVLIDTSTIRQANHYLVKGAIARRKVTELKKIVTFDSTIIAEQDSIIVKIRINQYRLQENNKALVTQNKAISRTLVVFKGVSIILLFITLLSWI